MIALSSLVAALAVFFQCLHLARVTCAFAPPHGSWRAQTSSATTSVVQSILSGPSRIVTASFRNCLVPLAASDDDDSDAGGGGEDVDPGIDVSLDPRLRRVRLSRAIGIDWGTDLSFSFVYVRGMEPSGAASLSGEVEVGDQICELRPVAKGGEEATSLIGAPFDEVMGAFASLGRDIRNVDVVFFRGTKEELKALCREGSSARDEGMITITVVQNKGARDEAVRRIEARSGCNVRQVLTDHGINVYQSVTRWTNCKGKQLCGTCIVNVVNGAGSTNRKSLDEGSTLRENPESYRLSCVTFAYGDVTVETFPPIKAAQWTR